MGLTKELLFGDDPRYDDDRQRLREQCAAMIDEFSVPYRGKRKGANGKWSAHWHLSVVTAAKELEIRYIIINGRFAFRTLNDRDAVSQRAEVIWREATVKYQQASFE